MSLAARLRQLESKIQPVSNPPEYRFDLGWFWRNPGLEPIAIRESTSANGHSQVEVMCQILGVEPREFKRELQRVAYSGRQ